MKKKVLSFMMVVALIIATTVVPAFAGNYDNIDFADVKGGWFYADEYGNIKADLNEAGIAWKGAKVGIRLFVDTDTADGQIVVNGETNGWVGHEFGKGKELGLTKVQDGVYTVYYEGKDFPETDGYANLAICSWSGVNFKILGIKLYVDGAEVATKGASYDAPAAAALPQTGTVSVLAVMAIGAALSGAGVTVCKKSRKEN